MMCSGSVYFQFVQIPHKETPFLSCTIRVQSGRNRKTSSQDAMQAMKTAHLRQKPGGAALLKKFALFTGHVQLIFFYKKDRILAFTRSVMASAAKKDQSPALVLYRMEQMGIHVIDLPRLREHVLGQLLSNDANTTECQGLPY